MEFIVDKKAQKNPVMTNHSPKSHWRAKSQYQRNKEKNNTLNLEVKEKVLLHLRNII